MAVAMSAGRSKVRQSMNVHHNMDHWNQQKAQENEAADKAQRQTIEAKLQRFQDNDLSEWLGDTKPRMGATWRQSVSSQSKNTRDALDGLSKDELELWVGQQAGGPNLKYFVDLIRSERIEEKERNDLVFDLVQKLKQSMSADERLAALMRTMLNIEAMQEDTSEKVTKLYAKDAFSLASIISEFKRMDDDASGYLDPGEFSAAIEEMHPPITLTGSEFRSFWREIDPSDDGAVSIKEFTTILEAEHEKYPNMDTQELLKNFIQETVEKIRAKADTVKDPKKVENIWDTHIHAPYNEWPSDKTGRTYICGVRIADYIMGLHKTMEDQEYSNTSFCIFAFISTMIVVSIVVYVVQTEPNIEHWEGWVGFEIFITGVFTIEFLLRILACRNPLMFWSKHTPKVGEPYATWYLFDTMNVVDFLACTPLYLEQLGTGGSFLGVIRIVRLFRLARLRQFKAIENSAGILIRAIAQSWDDAGPVIVTLVSFEVIIFSAVVYVAEQGTTFPLCEGVVPAGIRDKPTTSNFGPSQRGRYEAACTNGTLSGKCWWYDSKLNSKCVGFYYRTDSSQTGLACSDASWKAGECFESDPSPFYSIGATMWWSFTTITTVGYGDMSPTQPWGKLLGTITMLTGLIVISIFVVVVAGKYEESAYAYNQKRMVEKKVAEMTAGTPENSRSETPGMDDQEEVTTLDRGDTKQPDEGDEEAFAIVSDQLDSGQLFRDNDEQD